MSWKTVWVEDEESEQPVDVLVCDGCSKVNPLWRHANGLNSSKFCCDCGSFVSTKRLYKDEVERYNDKHKEYLLEQEEKGETKG